MENRLPIVIVGAGAAGILAAWRGASLGAKVLLCERNSKAGIKLLISGGGKCNITHDGSPEVLLAAFTQAERRFLKHSLFRFTNADMIAMLEAEGVRTLVRPDGRVFPCSGRARDVVVALLGGLRSAGAAIKLGTRIDSIAYERENGFMLSSGREIVRSAMVILSTGGVSYPKTGTTGDGITWAGFFGHTIVPLRPALAPIGVRPALPAEWQGVAVRGGRLLVCLGARRMCSWDGDILFTHEGISGPAALELSRQAAELLEHDRPSLRFDFFPSKDFAHLDEELNGLVRRHASRMISSVLEMLVPARLACPLIRSVGADPEKRGHVVTRDERRAITGLLKEWRLGDVSRIDIERGEVTAGGIPLSEVNPRTMESRLVPGLYLCGEMLDVAGPVGGYNLQAAFSTGYVAGESAARAWGAAGNSGTPDAVPSPGMEEPHGHT